MQCIIDTLKHLMNFQRNYILLLVKLFRLRYNRKPKSNLIYNVDKIQ